MSIAVSPPNLLATSSYDGEVRYYSFPIVLTLVFLFFGLELKDSQRKLTIVIRKPHHSFWLFDEVRPVSHKLVLRETIGILSSWISSVLPLDRFRLKSNYTFSVSL